MAEPAKSVGDFIGLHPAAHGQPICRHLRLAGGDAGPPALFTDRRPDQTISIAALWSLVYLITLLPFTINAFGLQEISITYAFSEIGGISPANSLALALLIRTLFMLASLPGAFFLSDVLPGVAQAQPLLQKLDK